MELCKCLQIYNKNNQRHNELLERIYINVSKEYFPGKNKYMINNIVTAFKNPSNILEKFDDKNINLLDEIKKYILSSCKDQEKILEIQKAMEEWGLFYFGIGIPTDIEKILVDRYRLDFVNKFNRKEKGNTKQLIYLEYLMFIKNIWKKNKEEQFLFIKKYNDTNTEFADLFVEYLLNCTRKCRLDKNRMILIENEYIENIQKDKFLIKTIIELYERLFENRKYNSYLNDIKRLHLIQRNIEEWIDLNKIGLFISNHKIELLKKEHLIEEFNSNYCRLIKLTDIGLSLAQGQFISKWATDRYYITNEKSRIIPHDYNPLIISRNIFNDEYNLIEKDFLLILEKKRNSIG